MTLVLKALPPCVPVRNATCHPKNHRRQVTVKASIDEDRYSWERDDQRRALLRQVEGGFPKILPRLTKIDDIDRQHKGDHYAWELHDQRLELANNAIERNIRSTARGCFVGDDPVELISVDCVESVNGTLTLLKHAEAKEAEAIARELLRVGGVAAAWNMQAWCLENQKARHAVMIMQLAEDTMMSSEKGESAGKTTDGKTNPSQVWTVRMR